MRRLSFLVFLVLAMPADAASGRKAGVGPAATPAPTLSGRGGGGGRMLREDPRRAPPLDPDRKVSEQDCTKPVDLSIGNLKCK